jgi:hypothetical protein
MTNFLFLNQKIKGQKSKVKDQIIVLSQNPFHNKSEQPISIDCEYYNFFTNIFDNLLCFERIYRRAGQKALPKLIA